MTVAANYGLYGYNTVHEVEYRGGLVGLFAGESQFKALTKQVDDLNKQGRVVAALVVDRWSFWKRLLWLLVLFVTLGFYTRVANVLVVSSPATGPVPQWVPPTGGQVAPPVAPSSPQPVAAATTLELPPATPASKARPKPASTSQPAPRKRAPRKASGS